MGAWRRRAQAVPAPQRGNHASLAWVMAALLAYYLVGSLVLAAYLWSPKSLLRPSLAHIRFRWALFKDILRVGLVGTVSTVATNLAIGITTALVGGTVDSHSTPITAEKMYTLIGVSGALMKMTMATARSK